MQWIVEIRYKTALRRTDSGHIRGSEVDVLYAFRFENHVQDPHISVTFDAKNKLSLQHATSLSGFMLSIYLNPSYAAFLPASSTVWPHWYSADDTICSLLNCISTGTP